jgi:hypothetical protein
MHPIIYSVGLIVVARFILWFLGFNRKLMRIGPFRNGSHGSFEK